MTRSITAAVLAVALLASAGLALAEEAAGKVQSVNSSDRSITLEDGTQLFLAEGVSIEGLREGASVKASFEERDGKKIVTGLEVGN